VLDAALLEEIKVAPPTDPKRKYQANYRMQRVNDLLALGASPNVAHPETKETPAHYAVLHGEEALLKTLLERGANPALRNRCGQTVAHYLALFHPAQWRQLPSALDEIKDDFGRTPQDLAFAVHGFRAARQAQAPAMVKPERLARSAEEHTAPAVSQRIAPATSSKRLAVPEAAPPPPCRGGLPLYGCNLT